MPKDKLTISVSTTDPEAGRPFNLTGGTSSYLVDIEGNINFPVLGRLHVQGLTIAECQDFLASKLKNYLAETENPIVTVTMSSFHITVLGEVGGGGVISISNDNTNFLEALAMAGDLTIYSKRDNILLIRQDEKGARTLHRLNVSDANIMNSPYFYVQQNDIIYVEAYKAKTTNEVVRANLNYWFTFLSLLTSVSTFAYLIFRKR